MFEDFKYRRPDMEQYKDRFKTYLEMFNKASSLEIQNDAIREINAIREEFGCMKAIAFIRHSQNVEDAFYKKENEFMSKAAAENQEMISLYYQNLLGSKYREELQKKWGNQLFNIAQAKVNTYAPEVSEDLKDEEVLAGQYMGILASAKVMFQGKEKNVMELYPYMESQQQNIRKKAQEAFSQVLQNNQKKLVELFDSLVKVRHKIARKLGYDNFLGLGYARLGRTDYTPEMVARFREEVYEHITPLVVRLRDRQRRRLGLESLRYYDEDIKFLSGNAVPVGGAEAIISNSRKMYGEMSAETSEFFSFMSKNGLLDLLDRDNKAKMGYCATIPGHRVPFVFSTFNGTSYDVSVMTHELGHAFQAYCSRDLLVPEYIDATAEVSELHALAMELLVWPWLYLFFNGEEDKYKYSSLADAITLGLSIGVMGDEFQQWVYTNPDATPEERNIVWRDIEKKYWPYRDYHGNEFYEQGDLWLRFFHFFQFPLYLIDYSLAQVCAFQFFRKIKEDYQTAWDDYVKLCRAGGSSSFLELLKNANLDSPFANNSVSSAIEPIACWFDEIDDNKL